MVESIAAIPRIVVMSMRNISRSRRKRRRAFIRATEDEDDTMFDTDDEVELEPLLPPA